MEAQQLMSFKRAYFTVLAILVAASNTVNAMPVDFPTVTTESQEHTERWTLAAITMQAETKNSTAASRQADEGIPTIPRVAEAGPDSTNHENEGNSQLANSDSQDQPSDTDFGDEESSEENEENIEECPNDEDTITSEDQEDPSGDENESESDNNATTTTEKATDLSEREVTSISTIPDRHITSGVHKIVERSTTAKQDGRVCNAAQYSSALSAMSGQVRQETELALSEFLHKGASLSLAAARRMSNAPYTKMFPIPEILSDHLENVDAPEFMNQLTGLLRNSTEFGSVLGLVKEINIVGMCFHEFYMGRDCNQAVLCQGRLRTFPEAAKLCQFCERVDVINTHVKQMENLLTSMADSVVSQMPSAADSARPAPALYRRESFEGRSVHPSEKTRQDRFVKKFTGVALFRVHSLASQATKLAEKFEQC